MDKNVKDLVSKFVREYQSKYNTINNWEEPLVAFSNAKDPLFLELKVHASETHKLPTDLLENAETVISYFIPFKKEVILSNSKGEKCSKEWAIVYIETNKLIVDLNEYLASKLNEMNYDSVILPPTHNFDKKELKSDWSHKHIAYIAGLGNFGVHQMLITDKGCCGRLGSLITNAKIKVTERNNKEYCLYFYDQSCKKCVEQCIFDALKIDTFDRHKCYSICLENGKLFSSLGLSDVCGKCVSIVPCSMNNPIK